MNNIEKTFKKKEKREASKIRKWWQKHGYKVLRVLLFYVWIPCWCHQKLKDKRYKEMSYNDNTTKKYLDKCLPTLVAHCEESSDVFLFHHCEDYGGIHFFWTFNSSWFEKKFKKQSSYFVKFSREVEKYIISNYQVNGYDKIVLDNYKLWSDACDRFDWNVPYNADNAVGVVFFKRAIV